MHTPKAAVDRMIIEAGLYMRGTIKTYSRHGGVVGEGVSVNEGLFDPKKPKAVRIYIATTLPECQDTCVSVLQESYSKVDDAQVKELLIERGLNNDKRATPFIQLFKVCRVVIVHGLHLLIVDDIAPHGSIWPGDCVPPCAGLLSESCSAQAAAVPEENLEFD